jgi:hypothetical protein
VTLHRRHRRVILLDAMDDGGWRDVVAALEAEGFDAALQEGFLDTLSIRVELGDAWSASITTGDGDLRTFPGAGEELQVAVDGPQLPGEGYTVTWWPQTQDVKRLAADVAPLLRRLHTDAIPQRLPAAHDVLDVADADAVLRALLSVRGTARFSTVWEAFCDFARRAVSERDPAQDEDLLLFEAAATGPATTVSLVRQFMEADDDDADMEQVICRVRIASRGNALDHPPLWGRAGDSAGDWIAQVEATSALTAANDAEVLALDVSRTIV